MLIITSEQLFTEMGNHLKTLEKGADIHIATYGMYVDITNDKDWALVYGASPQRKFIESALRNNRDAKIVVGIPYFMECTSRCNDCRLSYNDKLTRFKSTFEVLPAGNVRYHGKSHLKYYRVGDRVWVGGINMTGSDWVDIMVEIDNEDHKETLRKIFEDHFNRGQETVNSFYKNIGGY